MPSSKKLYTMAQPVRNGLLICSFNRQPKAYVNGSKYAYG